MIALKDRSAPGVRVTVLSDEKAFAGEPLDLGGRILEFSYEDAERQADKVTIQLDNHDLALFEREEIMGGSLLEVSWGYPDNMAPPRRVVVKTLKGFTTLTVEGQALSVLMNRRMKTRCFENQTRSQIVLQIAKENGYEGNFADIQDTSETIDTVNQTGETDAGLVRRLAGREGFEFFVDDGGLHFHERRLNGAPVKVYTWNADPDQGDVISLNVESDLVRRAGKVTVKGRDPLTRTTISSSANSASVSRATLGETIEVVDPETGATALEQRNATESVRPTSAATTACAGQEADARFKAAERETIKLAMTVVGDPIARAKTIIELRGVSALLAGKYYVTSIKHTVSSSGYTCEHRLTRDGIGRLPRPAARDQGGERNRAAPRTDGALNEIETIDPETGGTRIEYQRDGQAIGSDDPEALVRK